MGTLTTQETSQALEDFSRDFRYLEAILLEARRRKDKSRT